MLANDLLFWSRRCAGRIVYRLYLIHSTQLQVVIKKIITGAGVVY